MVSGVGVAAAGAQHRLLQEFEETDSAVRGHDGGSAGRVQWREYMVAEQAAVAGIVGNFDEEDRDPEDVLGVVGYTGDVMAAVLALELDSWSAGHNHHMVVGYAVADRPIALVALAGCSHNLERADVGHK